MKINATQMTPIRASAIMSIELLIGNMKYSLNKTITGTVLS